MDINALLEHLSQKLGLKKSYSSYLDDAVGGDPRAESEVNRTMTGVSPEQWNAMNREKLLNAPQIHGMESVKKVPRWQDALNPREQPKVVHLPPIQMEPDIQPKSAYDIQRGQAQAPQQAPDWDSMKPDAFTHGEDIIKLLAEAEARAGLPDGNFSGRGDGTGAALYSGGHLGKDRTEDDVLEYIKFLSEGQ